VRNVSSEPVKGVLHAEVDGIAVQQPVELNGWRIEDVKFAPEQFAKAETGASAVVVALSDGGRRISIRRS